MRCFKRDWDERRGDGLAGWGTSTWYFEVGDDRFVSRQLEVYANGRALKYDEGHPEDELGGLSESALDLEGDGFLPFEITRAEFEAAWASTEAVNRR